MTTTDTARAEAVAWLVGRLRWEQLLDELQRHADDADVRGTADVDVPVAA